MRKTVLPLPSVCVTCGITIKPQFVRPGRSGEFVWAHDAPLGVNLLKGGAHSAEPDPTYCPGRYRVVPGVAVPRSIDLVGSRV